MRHRFSALRYWIAALGSVSLIWLGPPARSGVTDEVTCTDHSIEVTESAAPSTTLRIEGTLCRPSGQKPRIVQLLVSGATYNRSYWDFGYQPETYSYARYQAARGHAAFTFDRINTGSSSEVSPFLHTVFGDAETISQMVAALRSGDLGGIPFDHVVLVGHSLGSFIAVTEAALFQDVDAVLLSGFTHYFGSPFLIGQPTGRVLVPAEGSGSSPYVQNQPPGEMSTGRVEDRAHMFYDPDTSDPAVIAHDEATKDTISMGELATVMTNGPLTSLIDVPVMIANGQSEMAVHCGDHACQTPEELKAYEAPLFPSAPSLDTFILQDAGHCINLHTNAETWFAAAFTWIEQLHLGPVQR